MVMWNFKKRASQFLLESVPAIEVPTLILLRLLVDWLAAASGHTVHSLKEFLDFCCSS